MGARLLLVDDDPDLLKLLSMRLGAAGYRVTAVEMHHAAVTQPIEQLAAVGRHKDVAESIGGMLALEAFGDDEKGKIVIPEDRHRARAQSLDEAHDRERLWTAIDEIADEPQGIARVVVSDRFEQPQQLIVAALHVADHIGAHAEYSSAADKKRRSMLRLPRSPAGVTSPGPPCNLPRP